MTVFSLRSDVSSDSDYDMDQSVRSRSASAMLGSFSTPTSRRTRSKQYDSSPFEVGSDDADGDKLADRYQMLEELGSGSFGVVYKAIEKDTGEIVAVKHVDLESSEEDLSDILSELSVLSSCASSHVTKYKLAFVRRQTLWIVMEFLGGGSCADLLKPPPHHLNESHIAIICKELLLGLSYLHGEGKIHRDIKAANVLLGMDGRVKLADFGVATQLSGLKSIRHTFVGTPFWMAPEVIQQEGHDALADVWSLGITAMELANGEPPHANVHPMKVLFIIPKQSAPKLEGNWSKDFKDFVAMCLIKDVDRRPSARELLKHRFIRGAGKHEGLQELVQRKQEWDAQRGGDKKLKYYAETLRRMKNGESAALVGDDDWVFETVKAVPTMDMRGMQTQKRRKVASIDLGDDTATRMMEDLNLDRGTQRRVSVQQVHSPNTSVRRSGTKKRVSSQQQRHPLGVNMSFGNSPSTVRQFRRVSPAVTTPDLENDDPLQLPKKASLKIQTDLDDFADHQQQIQPSLQSTSTHTPPDSPSRLSRYSSNASTLAIETKEATLGRRLYTNAIGISCQDVLNETGDERKREAVARLAEAYSDLEAIDPEGMYHIMQSMLNRMKTDTKLQSLLPRTEIRQDSLPTPVTSQPSSATGTTVQRSTTTTVTADSTPSTPNKPKLVMASNNPHLKSHRRRQSAQVPTSRDSSMGLSPISGSKSDELAAERTLGKVIEESFGFGGAGKDSNTTGLEHTRAMADVMFERWCEGLRMRWPAV